MLDDETKATWESQLLLARLICGMLSVISVPIWGFVLFQTLENRYGQIEGFPILIAGVVLVIPALLLTLVSVFLLRFSTRTFSISGLILSMSMAVFFIQYPRTVLFIDDESIAPIVRLSFLVGIPLLFVHSTFSFMLSMSRKKCDSP